MTKLSPLGETIYQVLLVEDDPMVQEVNRQFVEQVEGFEIIGTASTGKEGLTLARSLRPDLLILDIFIPMMDGMETLTAIRSEGLSVDVIVISAANDMATIQRMLQNGAVDYIMKPFKFERVKQALEHYRVMKQSLKNHPNLSQQELDDILFGYHADFHPQLAFEPVLSAELPKGIHAITLKQIVQFLSVRGTLLSAEEVAEGVGIARVTARRYLDYLVKHGQVRIDLQYGVGRPVNKYILVSAPSKST